MANQRTLFVVDLRYTAPLSRVDELLAPHLDYLERGYADGVFIASGRKEPRNGGIILAVGRSREEIEARVAGDPFVRESVADAIVIQVVPGRLAPGELRSWLDSPAPPAPARA